MVERFIIFVSILGSFISHAEEPKCKNTGNSFQCLEFIRNYDADTLTFKINQVHPLLGDKIPIRLRGVDTPELRTKNLCEKKLGYKAKQLVNQKIGSAKKIDLINCTRGKYFRLVCDIILDGESLSRFLVQNKYAYPYDGGTKMKVDWCNYRTKKRVPASN